MIDMTIYEAIEKYKEITNTDANCPAHCNIPCDKCVQESEQLAEWLEELKFRRVLQLQCEKEFFAGYEKGKKEGYNKAIDYCIEIVKFHRDSWDGIEWAIRDIEKLKAGGENDKSI